MTLMDRSEAHVGHADQVTSDILRCPTVTLMDRSEAHVGHADKVTSDILRCPINKRRSRQPSCDD